VSRTPDPHRPGEPNGPGAGARAARGPAGGVVDAIAAVTCWLDDDRDRATRIAAVSIDRDAVGFLDALGGLWVVVSDVCAELEVDVPSVVRDVALGVAQAEQEDDG
jgi:hypothetical protein